MPLLKDVTITLGVDQVLRAQGADPAKIRERSPRLVEMAERALEAGRPLLVPQVLYDEVPVEGFTHQKLRLAGGGSLEGRLIAQHLAAARRVILALCTIGEPLERYASEVSSTSIMEGLALDGVGSAAVESLANLICRHFEERATMMGEQVTIPLSPGMAGWSVASGQPQIFALLNGQEVGVTLSKDCVMRPCKSLTMVIGVGVDVQREGNACDYCTMSASCQYRNRDE